MAEKVHGVKVDGGKVVGEKWMVEMDEGKWMREKY
jgi:hypothetical protein